MERHHPTAVNTFIETFLAYLRLLEQGFVYITITVFNLLGPGSVISNSQDDIDDDAASSIYCPSAGRPKNSVRQHVVE